MGVWYRWPGRIATGTSLFRKSKRTSATAIAKPDSCAHPHLGYVRGIIYVATCLALVVQRANGDRE